MVILANETTVFTSKGKLVDCFYGCKCFTNESRLEFLSFTESKHSHTTVATILSEIVTVCTTDCIFPFKKGVLMGFYFVSTVFLSFPFHLLGSI